jgi:hypothetical protein
MSDPIDKSKTQVQAMDVIAYAGTPNGIPSEELMKNWGALNKQLAFSNLSHNEIQDIEDLLRISELRAMSSQRDYELRQMDVKGAGQAIIITKCLESLGRDGFLLKRATTSEHSITNKTDSGANKQKFFGLGAPKQQYPQQQYAQQGVRQ